MRYFILFFLCIATFAEASVELRAGYRQDYLRWSIGCDEVDTLSELKWKDLHILDLEFYADAHLFSNFRLWFDTEVGPIIAGLNRDSDYASSGRLNEFCRSHCDVEGAVVDLTLGLGHWAGCWCSEVGVALHGQVLCDTRGQTELLPVDWDGLSLDSLDEIAEVNIPFADEINSAYTSAWATMFAGAGWQKRYSEGRWELQGRAHIGTYGGRGDWYLREFDYFAHEALAVGLEGEIKLEQNFFRWLQWTIQGRGRCFYSSPGWAITVTGDEGLLSRFNGVLWNSFSIQTGFRIGW